MKQYQITISVSTVIKVVAVLAGFALIWKAWEVIAIVFVALFLSAIIQPVADWAAKYKIPRSLTVIGTYIVVIGLLAAIISFMAPTLVRQATNLGTIFGERWETIQETADEIKFFADQYDILPESGIASLQDQIGTAVTRVFKMLTGFFGGIAAVVIVLVITFYLVSQDDKAKTLVNDWVAPKNRKFVLKVIDQLQLQMGRWFRGQLVLSLIIGFMVYIGLLIIGIEGALVLALFAAVLEFIPYLGPILASIPILFVAFTQSPFHLIAALIVLVVIQQSENQLIVPKVMQKAVGLNPLVSIISMLIGARLFGVLGALVAIPFATAAMVIVQEIRAYKEKNK